MPLETFADLFREFYYLRKWADEIARGTGKFEVPGKLEDLLQRTRP